MIQVARWKIALVILATVFGIVFSAPNLVPQKTLDTLPKWVPAKQLNLGLDLRGGSYLQLSVDVPGLIHEHLINMVEDVRNGLNNEGIKGNPTLTGTTISLTVEDPAQLDAAYKIFNNLNQRSPGQTTGPDLTITRQPATRLITATYRKEAADAEASRAVERSREILRKRIDPDGTKEISITREGPDRIVLQAPGDKDPEYLKNMVKTQAHLTFQMVDDSMSPEAMAAGILPPGTEILPYADDSASGEPATIVVRRKAVVAGDSLTDAHFGFGDRNQPVVNFRFNGVGAKAFGQTTLANVGKRFAIVLDGKVISAPRINTPITGGQGYIEGSFTNETATDLATLLNAGALPVKLTVEDVRSTTAELGQDAINAGKISTAIGFAAIVVFMLLAYGLLFGGVSVIGLVLNLLLMVAILSLNRAALTLPGIAGLILTLAVAVDANVLIYERIRDEERAGQSPLMALETGFKRASVSILDANVTTLISAVIMFAIAGSGPVKGFAWTLAVGVVTSVFTAMLVSQVLLGWWFRAAKPKQLPI